MVSSFTNIPSRLVVIILEFKWERIELYTTLKKGTFLDLINFIFNNTFFTFNKKIYRQCLGTPMGSPISPIITTIILDELLNNVIPILPFRIPIIYKYVDDHDLVCSVSTDKNQETLNIFNSFNPHLQFTLEVENDRSIPF